MNNKLYLASTSPYRKQSLQKLGLAFTTLSPGVDEGDFGASKPQVLAQLLADSKALTACNSLEPQTPGLIIGGDQICWHDGNQLHKPGNRTTAIEQLQQMRGHEVTFYTALSLVQAATCQVVYQHLDITKVTFRELTNQKIEQYIDAEQPFDCAGGFKVEGLGISLFERIESQDPSALVGISLIGLTSGLLELGYPILESTLINSDHDS